MPLIRRKSEKRKNKKRKTEINHENLRELSIDLVKNYVRHIRIREDEPEYQPLQKNMDLCIELFRYSLCIALDLSTTLNCCGLEGLTDYSINFLRGHLKLGLDKYAPEAVLQASMHCMLRARSLAKGDIPRKTFLPTPWSF